MRFDVITLFPEIFSGFLQGSLLGKALQRGLLEAHLWNLQDYGHGKWQKVDDDPYGGGAGMVICPEPVIRAVTDARSDGGTVVYLSPQGELLTQSLLKELSLAPQLVLLCGRYEGIDERAIDRVVDREISIGDYVLNGGEVPAMVLMEGVARLIPGFMKEYESLEDDSFFDGLLDHPHYTRPREYEGASVPEVLLSGDHQRIAAWRREQKLLRTRRRRPDLLERADLTPEERAWLESQE